ncbi:MAG TPA: YciI family protein, partial [Acidimicrobiales bacterium]|nr:YciI family protein [Acidimicrobiales bacterium]
KISLDVSILPKAVRRSARVKRGTPHRDKETETIMRFLGYTLANEAETPTEPPRPELYEEMGKFVEEAVNAGVIVATGGIAPTSEGAKISLKDGEFTIVDGPFTEAKELVGGWALMECRDRAEAIEWSKRFISVLGEGEVRIRPVI